MRAKICNAPFSKGFPPYPNPGTALASNPLGKTPGTKRSGQGAAGFHAVASGPGREKDDTMAQIPASGEKNNLSLTKMLFSSMQKNAPSRGERAYEEIASGIFKNAERARTEIKRETRQDFLMTDDPGKSAPRAPERKENNQKGDSSRELNEAKSNKETGGWRKMESSPKAGENNKPAERNQKADPSGTNEKNTSRAKDGEQAPRTAADSKTTEGKTARTTGESNGDKIQALLSSLKEGEASGKSARETGASAKTQAMESLMARLEKALSARAANQAGKTRGGLQAGEGLFGKIGEELNLESIRVEPEAAQEKSGQGKLSTKQIEVLSKVIKSMISQNPSGDENAALKSSKENEAAKSLERGNQGRSAQNAASGAKGPVTTQPLVMAAPTKPAEEAPQQKASAAPPSTAQDAAAVKHAPKVSNPVPASSQNLSEKIGDAGVSKTEGAAPKTGMEMDQRIQRAQAILDRTIKGLVRLCKGGGGRTVIHLRPETLGKIRLEVIVENSLASAQVLAENPNVRDAIMRDISLLREALAQQGIQLEHFDVRDGQSQADMSAFDRSDERSSKGESSRTARENGREGAPEKAGVVPTVQNPFGTINLTI